MAKMYRVYSIIERQKQDDYPASDGGVVGTPNYRGIPLGQGASIHRPR
jgi:hypothetical protein